MHEIDSKTEDGVKGYIKRNNLQRLCFLCSAHHKSVMLKIIFGKRVCHPFLFSVIASWSLLQSKTVRYFQVSIIKKESENS